jgi:hypothetical protein
MKLPLEYRWLKANGFKGFIPWYMIEEPNQDGLRAEYQKETGEDFFPFARRQDRDDVAGFKVVNGDIKNTVVSVHLTWSGKREQEGFPKRTDYRDMFEWLKNEVIHDTWEWMSEEDLQDIIEDNA